MEALIKDGAAAALCQAFVLSAKCKPSDERDGILSAALNGLLQLSKLDSERQAIMESGVGHVDTKCVYVSMAYLN